MKHIISTTGSPITFKLRLNRTVMIDTKIAVQVSEEEFALLQSRLGMQVKDVTSQTSKNPSSEFVQLNSTAETPADENQTVPSSTTTQPETTPENTTADSEGETKS